MPKIIDAFSTAGIAAAMQAPVIGPFILARYQIREDPDLSGPNFIIHGMVMAFFFGLSLTFFIMALIKFYIATRDISSLTNRRILIATEVLLLSTGICILAESALILYKTVLIVVL